MNMHHLRQTETFYLTRIKKRPYDSFDEKDIEEEQVILFIEEADPTRERWYGRKVTVDEAKRFPVSIM